MIRYAVTPDHVSRRTALQLGTCGFGYLAFAGLAAQEAAARDAEVTKPNPLAAKPPHFAAKAKRVIFLCMTGGPSHVDTFDHKPRLTADDGKAPPSGTGRGAFAGKLLGSPWKFKKHGKSGLWMSELFPELGAHADEMCVLNGMHTNVPAHPQAFLQLHTGTSQFVRPSLGAWTLYGLGTENQNLPGFVSVNPPTGNGGAQNYGSAFLPAIYQGTRIGNEGRSVSSAKLSNIANPRLGPDAQRSQLDFVQALNKERLERDQVNPQVEGVIESYELAFRMQRDVPKVMDLSGETKETMALYGVGGTGTDDFGRQCLLARRFVEAGVRYVEVTHGNWDQHRNLRTDLARHTAAIDKPIAGLLADLKRRGLLADTLVVWSGEFGRTPFAQGTDGRDHNNKGFSAWLAGGGVKGGLTYGATDEHGFAAVTGRVHTHDFHATILHLLGLNHEKLTYRYAGRDFRLTDVAGNVVKDVVA
ncbi:DUF1501 domain-containing protein [Fimbriiglobus ruber]|uniref:Sulfatase n=1 Tax=Fimbriiglobus ruber TaxID=1908690 RepID=A0A225DQ51_9BACT|nr:DUF1501 domain-containing protein [Fimbriiglobus ruber]OWK43492.1 sulfatase [Fimbriiglobus ruber]